MAHPTVDNHFSYHAPTGPEQIAKYQRIRDAGKAFAEVLLDEVPPCNERSAAYERVREAVMLANAGVACNPDS